MRTTREKGYFYILTNNGKNVLYAGSTKNLIERVKQHRKGYQKGFTQKYNVNRLVYWETFEQIGKAKGREKQIKGWKRQRKIELIEAKNKLWKDLYEDLVRDPSLRSGFRDRKHPNPSL
jgi:putative endonuclease